MAETKFGTFEQLIAKSPDDIRKLATAARKLVLSVHPKAVEIVRLGDGAATYGLGPKKMTEAHTYISPHSKHLNLGFFYGAHLKDPDKLLDGTGANMRHVKVRSPADLKRCRRLIETALAERRKALAL